MLDRILRAPALGSDGALMRFDGYHPAHHVFLDLPVILAGLPTPMPRAQAVPWLRDELLADFPFVVEADRKQAVAALLLPFVRPAIDSPTPLRLVEVPTEGTGKCLLVEALVRVASGRPSQPTTVARSDDATRKKLTAILAEAPAAVVLENLAGLVDSASLAAVLTATTWADRRLGEAQMLALPNHALWSATGNNPLLSREIARRAVRVRLDAGPATPWTGRTYRHANLARWTDAHRRDLIGAALGLVQAWVDVGQPAPERSLGSFESWARVGGGIVTHAGFGGFQGSDAPDVCVDPEEARTDEPAEDAEPRTAALPGHREVPADGDGLPRRRSPAPHRAISRATCALSRVGPRASMVIRSGERSTTSGRAVDGAAVRTSTCTTRSACRTPTWRASNRRSSRRSSHRRGRSVTHRRSSRRSSHPRGRSATRESASTTTPSVSARCSARPAKRMPARVTATPSAARRPSRHIASRVGRDHAAGARRARPRGFGIEPGGGGAGDRREDQGRRAGRRPVQRPELLHGLAADQARRRPVPAPDQPMRHRYERYACRERRAAALLADLDLDRHRREELGRGASLRPTPSGR